MPLDEVVTEHFLARYRALLDAEDCAFDELEHARRVAQHFGTDHYEFVVKPDAVTMLLPLKTCRSSPLATSCI